MVRVQFSREAIFLWRGIVQGAIFFRDNYPKAPILISKIQVRLQEWKTPINTPLILSLGMTNKVNSRKQGFG